MLHLADNDAGRDADQDRKPNYFSGTQSQAHQLVLVSLWNQYTRRKCIGLPLAIRLIGGFSVHEG
jgi:hypothetical protein